ncbi:hypothetical protein HYX10_00830 [Candidatus Woesearchaeota archaeon]|nr:hypothetical protein [Candidatus Woesearchaeota archaeon]
MWPFSERRAGKTVAERRKDSSSQVVKLADTIHRLQSRVVWIERNAPYEKNDKRRENLDKEKLRLERQIQALERQHHALSGKR